MTKIDLSKRLAIILLSWNSHNRTAKLISALSAAIPIDDHIFVIDNGSTEEFQHTDQNVVSVLRSETNLGFAGGNNVGIRQALKEGYQYILMLNTDLDITYQQIEQLITVLKQRSHLALVGPVLQEGDTLMFGGRDIGLHLNTRLKKPTADVSHFYIPGTVLLIRSEVFGRIGLLDENYFFSGEVADFCTRAGLVGEEIGIDQNTLVHHEIETASTLRDTLYVYYNFRNRFLYVRKFHEQKKIPLFFRWIRLGAVQYAGAIKQLRFKKARAIRLAIVHGLFGKYGNQHGRFS